MNIFYIIGVVVVIIVVAAASLAPNAVPAYSEPQDR
jgi:hypothetical protein